MKRTCVVRSTYITVPGWPPVRRQPSSPSSPCHCFISLNSYLWLSYIETQGIFSKSTFERAFQLPFYIYMYNYIYKPLDNKVRRTLRKAFVKAVVLVFYLHTDNQSNDIKINSLKTTLMSRNYISSFVW